VIALSFDTDHSCEHRCEQCEEEEEDLKHLLEYRKRREDALQDEDREDVDSPGNENRVFASVMKDLFHVTALQVLNPLEFKEVKMLAVEILTKLPVDCVLPFALSHLVAFAREELSRSGATTSSNLVLADGDDNIKTNGMDERRTLAATAIPQGSCGIVAAKLLVYYLNRVLSEGSLFGDKAYRVTASSVLGVLFLLLHIPCDGDGSDAALLADLQLGCIDWVAQLLLFSESLVGGGADTSGITDDDCERFVELLIEWMLKGDREFSTSSPESTANRPSRLTELVQKRMRHFAPLTGNRMSIQFRICCCNVLLRCDLITSIPRLKLFDVANSRLPFYSAPNSVRFASWMSSDKSPAPMRF